MHKETNKKKQKMSLETFTTNNVWYRYTWGAQNMRFRSWLHHTWRGGGLYNASEWTFLYTVHVGIHCSIKKFILLDGVGKGKVTWKKSPSGHLMHDTLREKKTQKNKSQTMILCQQGESSGGEETSSWPRVTHMQSSNQMVTTRRGKSEIKKKKQTWEGR